MDEKRKYQIRKLKIKIPNFSKIIQFNAQNYREVGKCHIE